MSKTNRFYHRRQQQKAAKRARKLGMPQLPFGTPASSGGSGGGTFVSFNAKTMRFETAHIRDEEQDDLRKILAEAKAQGEDLSQAEILARLRPASGA